MTQSQNDTVCVIKGDGTVSVSTTDGGIKKAKIVSLEAFSQALRSDQESFELPLLPAGIRKYKRSGDYLVIAIEYPDQIIPEFTYNGNNYAVPVPRCVWLTLLSLNNNSVDTYRIHKTWPFALDMPLLSEEQNLYKWPFTNWSLGFNNICWGSHESFRTIRDSCKITNVSSQYSMYFNANANDHLGWDCDLPREDRQNHAQFLDGKTEFDVSWLESERMTFSSAVDRIVGRNR
jgi:hypothetical protein